MSQRSGPKTQIERNSMPVSGVVEKDPENAKFSPNVEPPLLAKGLKKFMQAHGSFSYGGGFEVVLNQRQLGPLLGVAQATARKLIEELPIGFPKILYSLYVNYGVSIDGLLEGKLVYRDAGPTTGGADFESAREVARLMRIDEAVFQVPKRSGRSRGEWLAYFIEENHRLSQSPMQTLKERLADRINRT